MSDVETIERDLKDCRSALADARARHEEAAERLGDCSSDPHSFARARRARDEAAAETERLALRLGRLESDRERAVQAAKAARRQQLAIEQQDLVAKLARLEAEGLQQARQLAATIRGLTLVREQALTVDHQINRSAILATAPEPVELFKAVIGCANALRSACPYSKPGFETSIPLMPEESTDGEKAA